MSNNISKYYYYVNMLQQPEKRNIKIEASIEAKNIENPEYNNEPTIEKNKSSDEFYE